MLTTNPPFPRLWVCFLCCAWATLALGQAVSAAEVRDGPAAASPAPAVAENLLIVTIDGARWQEVFTGAEALLIDGRTGGVRDVEGTRRDYLRQTPEERRAVLMPFLWSVVARDGQLFGDAAAGSPVAVTNGKNFSYPGYAEMFCGLADARVDSNDKVANPNLTLFELLGRRERFRGRMACFASWDVIPFCINAEKAGVRHAAGWFTLADEPLTEAERQLNAMSAVITRPWHNATYDAFTMTAAMQHLRKRRPRVLFVSLNEADEWAHLRRYDLYLQSIRNADAFVKRLWEEAQSMEQYRGRTALLVTTDHGRGDTWATWVDHSARTRSADRGFIAALGTGVPPRGVRKETPTTLSQLAATAAALLGEDFRAAAPAAAAPLPITNDK